jgi:hypothetical protein
MIRTLLVAVVLPFVKPAMSTPLNALRGDSGCSPVIVEYIDFSRCGMMDRTALVYEVAPTEAPADVQGDSMPEIKKDAAEINLFPNPVNGNNLYIELRGDGNEAVREVRVYNILGRDIITQPLEEGKNLVSVGGLDEGIYFVDVVERGQVIRTIKLIRK